jgi:hypothetical protein
MVLRRSFVFPVLVSVLAACLPAYSTDSAWQLCVDQLLAQSKGPSYNQYNLSAQQIELLRNIDEEENHLEAVISMGLHNGRLSADQAAHFRGELNRLSELKTSSVGDKLLTYPEAKQLVDLADTLIQDLTQSYQSGTPSAAFSASIPYPLYEQDKHRDIILNKILTAKSAGAISEDTFGSLRSQLDLTTAKMDKMREKKGYLSRPDREILNADLKQLDALVTSTIHQ